MPSIEGLLSIARTAMLAQQAAIDTAGHNIANAGAPGYTRQSAVLAALEPLRTPGGVFGRGVNVVDVRSSRDALLTQGTRSTQSAASGATTRRDVLAQLDAVLGEPSDHGLMAGMDAFWNAWSDLANAPSDHTARVAVQRRGEALAWQFNAIADQLSTLTTDTRAAAVRDVNRVNELAAQIAAVNDQILPAESGGHQASDLRDARDRLIDELSTLIPVSVVDRPDGGNIVHVGGLPIVDGNSSKSIALSTASPPIVTFAGSVTPLRLGESALSARVELLATELPQAQAQLDQLASALVTDVNAVHVAGWSPAAGASGNWDPLAGPTGSGISFFDPAGTTSRTLRLSAPVAGNAANIAAGDALDATGNNRTALALAALRTAAPSSPQGSFGSEYQALVAEVANRARTADGAATVATTLSTQARSRQQAMTGVSTDEELVALIRYQQAYAASARLIEVARGLYDALLSIGN